MKYIKFLILLPLAACLSNSSNNTVSSISLQADSTFLRTGFYELSDSYNGLKKTEEYTGETVYLSPKPLTSVDDVIASKLTREHIDSGRVDGINLQYNAKGTAALSKFSANPDVHKTAVVIANRLMYIVEIKGHITTGNVSIYLSNQSEQEIEALRQLIEQKK